MHVSSGATSESIAGLNGALLFSVTRADSAVLHVKAVWMPDIDPCSETFQNLLNNDTLN